MRMIYLHLFLSTHDTSPHLRLNRPIISQIFEKFMYRTFVRDMPIEGSKR
jgi:hypothetical protein